MRKMDDLDSWFKKEVYRPRMLRYLGLTHLLMIAGLLLFSLLLKIATSIPYFCLPDGYTQPASHGGLATHFLLLSFSTSLLWLLHLRHLSVEPHYPTRRILRLAQWLMPFRVLHLATFVLSGAFSSHCFLICALGTGISEGVWAGRHWFVVGAGAFCGLAYGLHYFCTELALLRFPIVQFSKARVIKSRLLRNQLPESLYYPMKNLLWYYPFYWIYLGSALEKQLIHYFWAAPDTIHLSWNGLLDPSLLATTWLSVSFLHWLWNCLVILAQVIFSERFKFSIRVEGPINQTHLLHKCLTAKDAYTKYLAFHDLKLLAQTSPERRKEVFFLDTVGAPRYWPPISAACLSVIQDFLKSLDGPSSAPPKKEYYTPADLPSPHPGMRRIMVCNAPPSSGVSQPPAPPSMLEIIRDQVVCWWTSRPAVKFFLAKIPEVHVRRAFALSQPVVWAVEALCFLVAASPVEDSFGVVQMNLSEVLSSLLKLQMVLEKTGGLRSPATLDVQLQRSLKHSLSLGFHNLTQAFGPNLFFGVSLSEEQRRYLESFSLSIQPVQRLTFYN